MLLSQLKPTNPEQPHSSIREWVIDLSFQLLVVCVLDTQWHRQMNGEHEQTLHKSGWWIHESIRTVIIFEAFERF